MNFRFFFYLLSVCLLSLGDVSSLLPLHTVLFLLLQRLHGLLLQVIELKLYCSVLIKRG
ncbi:hypothetical protein AHAS_Ahas10G0105900 [Arachis hypogaea]